MALIEPRRVRLKGHASRADDTVHSAHSADLALVGKVSALPAMPSPEARNLQKSQHLPTPLPLLLPLLPSTSHGQRLRRSQLGVVLRSKAICAAKGSSAPPGRSAWMQCKEAGGRVRAGFHPAKHSTFNSELQTQVSLVDGAGMSTRCHQL